MKPSRMLIDFEQEFHEGQMLDEWYEVTHHTPDKPLYIRIYDGQDEYPLRTRWGGVQVRDTRDNWLGWRRIWPVWSDNEDLGNRPSN